jgi:hypothetical protein
METSPGLKRVTRTKKRRKRRKRRKRKHLVLDSMASPK